MHKTTDAHFQNSTGMSLGSTAFPHLASLFLILAKTYSSHNSALHFPHSSTLQSTFSINPSHCAPLSTFPSLSLFTLTCCTSFTSQFFCLANLYKSTSVSSTIQVLKCSLFGLWPWPPYAASLSTPVYSCVLSVSHFFLANLFLCLQFRISFFHH